MPLDPKLQERINEIRSRFLEVLNERLLEFGEIRTKLDENACSETEMVNLRFGVHKIIGVSSTLGFDRLGDFATGTMQDIEAFVQSENDVSIRYSLMDSLDALLAEIRSISLNEATS